MTVASVRVRGDMSNLGGQKYQEPAFWRKSDTQIGQRILPYQISKFKDVEKMSVHCYGNKQKTTSGRE